MSGELLGVDGPEWLRADGSDSDVVMSSRVRLARNIAGFPFLTNADDDDRRQVLDLVRRLAEQGRAVVLVTHNLEDLFRVSDRIAVLRLGRNAGEFRTADTSQQEVVHAITAGGTRPGTGEAA